MCSEYSVSYLSISSIFEASVPEAFLLLPADAIDRAILRSSSAS
jgi:hypothetical protein